MKLIAVLQALDLLLSMNTLIPAALFNPSSKTCLFLGFFEQLFSTSEVIWISWFSLFVYRNICQNKATHDCIDIRRALLATFLITFPPALIFGVLGFYKFSEVWCWIDYGSKMLNFFIFQFLCSYVFVFLSVAWGSFVMFSVYKKLRQNNITTIDKNILRLQVYPLIMFLCYIFMFIFRVLEAFELNIPEGYEDFSSFVINLVGFINFLVLGFTEEFRRGIKFVRGKESDLELIF